MNVKLKNLFFILILGSVCAFLLVGIRNYTLPIIETYHELRLKRTILEAAGISHEKDTIEDIFSKYIRRVDRKGFIYYLSPDGSYIFIFEGRGLWGMITGAITLNPDLKTIENIKIVSQEETPGLGARIEEEGFLNQFKKKEVYPKLVLALRKKATKINEIDAIAGASMTSNALINIINEGVIDFRHAFK